MPEAKILGMAEFFQIHHLLPCIPDARNTEVGEERFGDASGCHPQAFIIFRGVFRFIKFPLAMIQYMLLRLLFEL